jgi:hypothetical protein
VAAIEGEPSARFTKEPIDRRLVIELSENRAVVVWFRMVVKRQPPLRRAFGEDFHSAQRAAVLSRR